MKRKLLAALICLTLICALLPGTAHAAPPTWVFIDGSRRPANASGTGWTLDFRADDALLTLTNYSSTDMIRADEGKLTIVLNGKNEIGGSLEGSAITISGSGSLLVKAGIQNLIFASGALTIDHTTVTAGGPQNPVGIYYFGTMNVIGSTVTGIGGIDSGILASALTVSDGSTVRGSSTAGHGVYVKESLLVTGGSTLTGTTEDENSFGVLSSKNDISVADPGSRIQGVNRSTGLNITGGGIAARKGISGTVTDPIGGVFGVYSYDAVIVVEDYTVVMHGGVPARSATLSAPTAASVPKAGDDTPLVLLCALMLFSGAGLTVRAVRRRRIKER